ncbi:MAG: ParB N-terminal domain-containing protein [Hungatella sp.]|nr:ParB N-terminal domain-containing protein [Hungatella sp.]
MAKDSGFNLVEMLNQRSKEQLKGSGTEEERREEDGRAAMDQEPERQEVMMIDVEDLIPSKDNFYRVDDSLKRSIEIVGILQPLLVSGPENGKYRVIAGHRRRLAALSLVKEGNESGRYVPCIYKREEVGDRLALIMANRFRDKSDWERMREIVEAEELARELKRDHGLEGRSRDVLAQIMGMSQAQIGRYKAIYNHLDQGLMEAFREGSLNFSAASELCGLPVEWQRRAERLMKVNGVLTLPEIRELKERRELREEMAVSETLVKSGGFGEMDPVNKEEKRDQGTKGVLEISEGAGEKSIPREKLIEPDGCLLWAAGHGELRGYVAKSDHGYGRRVSVCPIVYYDGEMGEKEGVMYGCPVCEMLGNRRLFSRGTENCPACGVNLGWAMEEPEGDMSDRGSHRE